MSHLSTTLRIEAPAFAVWDLIADPARSPEWQTLLADMSEIAGRAGGIGSSFVGFYKIAGRKLASHFVVTAAERPTILQVNGTTGGGWTRWTTTIDDHRTACEIHVQLEYELAGEIVGSLFGLLTSNLMEREFRRTYDNLKALAEAATQPTPISAAASFDLEDDDEEVGRRYATN